jgi:hypothetical protein
MKIIFEMDLEEKPTNIGIAKALTETHLGTSDLSAISRYLSVYCDEMVFFDYPTEKGGDE